MGFVVKALHGSFLESPVHALDLAIGPWMFWLGQSVVDVGLSTGELERMGAEEFSPLEGEFDLRSRGTSIAGRGEVHAVVGKHGMYFVGHGLDECVRWVAFSWTSTKANFEVRSMATRR